MSFIIYHTPLSHTIDIPPYAIVEWDAMADWMPNWKREEFRRLGSKGGHKAASHMTKAQRVARARKAGKKGAKVRWGKKGRSP